jgi:hypothetical protein
VACAFEPCVDERTEERVERFDARDRRIHEFERRHLAASHELGLIERVEVGQFHGASRCALMIASTASWSCEQDVVERGEMRADHRLPPVFHQLRTPLRPRDEGEPFEHREAQVDGKQLRVGELDQRRRPPNPSSARRRLRER